MNRRNVLILGPAACTAAFITPAANAEPKTDTPIIRMFREWERVSEVEVQVWNEWEDADGIGISEKCDEISKLVRSLEQKISETPCQNARDFVAKVIAVTISGAVLPEYFQKNQALWKQAREFVG